jgi:hypothetical protein
MAPASAPLLTPPPPDDVLVASHLKVAQEVQDLFAIDRVYYQALWSKEEDRKGRTVQFECTPGLKDSRRPGFGSRSSHNHAH